MLVVSIMMGCATRQLALVALLFAGLAGCGDSSSSGGSSAGPAGTTSVNASSPLGMNLAGVTYYSSELVFQDLFKQSAEWLPQQVSGGPWDTGLPFAGTTSDGYPLLNPGQAAGTLMGRDFQGRYASGPYTCFYDGTGTITLGFDAAVTSQSPGQIQFTVTPSNGGIYLKITASSAADPIRNIRVVPQAYLSTYAAQPFTPRFLDRHKRFKVLRFMDFQRMNNSTLANWADRARPATYSQGTARGVALEYMIQLSNALDADAWFCMPHLATDDFVTSFATLVRETLKPTLKVYIEHSNEVWNGIFSQAGYARTRGLALGLSANDFEAQLRYHSRRSVEIFSVWQSVFGGTSRLVRVLATQAANPGTGRTVMQWQDAYTQADALAIAPYFGGFLGDPATQNTVAAMTVSQLLNQCSNHITGQVTTWISENATEARARGLELIAYEGGQHLAGNRGAENNEALTALFMTANRDAGMKQVYAQYLGAWRANGGRMLANFSSVGLYSKWGSWGILEFDDENTGPKYDALLEFIAANPRWW